MKKDTFEQRQKKFNKIANDYYAFTKTLPKSERHEWLDAFYKTLDLLIKFER